jgi:glycosyltransferase 2 family protein
MTAEKQGWLARHWLGLLVSCGIGGGLAWLMHAGALPILPARSAFAHMRWWTVPAYVGIWCVVHFVRAARWYFLLEPVHRVPLRRVLAVAFIGFAAILLLPFRAGEVVRPVLIRKKGHLSGWAATGTVGAERVIDGLCMSIILFIALQLSHRLDPLPNRIGQLPVPASVVPDAAYSALALFAAAFAVMGVFYWRREFARRVTERVVGVVSKRLGAWLAERVENVAAGLRFLPRARYLLPFLSATAGYWLLNAAASWLLAWGAGFEGFTYAQACVGMGVLALGILLPNAPGFFGAFQISIYAGFAMFFPPEQVVGPGSAYVLLIYVCQVAITFVAGALGLVWERTGLREALDARTEELGS